MNLAVLGQAGYAKFSSTQSAREEYDFAVQMCERNRTIVQEQAELAIVIDSGDRDAQDKERMSAQIQQWATYYGTVER